jgi:hypothetical protein
MKYLLACLATGAMLAAPESGQELPLLGGFRLGLRFDAMPSGIPCSNYAQMQPFRRAGADLNFGDFASTARVCHPADSVSLSFAADTLRIVYVTLSHASVTPLEYWNSTKVSMMRSLGDPDSVTIHRESDTFWLTARWTNHTLGWSGIAQFWAPLVGPLGVDPSNRSRAMVAIALCHIPRPSICDD